MSQWPERPQLHPVFTGYIQVASAVSDPWNKPDGTVVQKFKVETVLMHDGRHQEMTVWANSLFALLIPGSTYEADFEINDKGYYKIRALRPWAGNPAAREPWHIAGPGVVGQPMSAQPAQPAPAAYQPVQPGVPPFQPAQAGYTGPPLAGAPTPAYNPVAGASAINPNAPTKDMMIQRQNALNVASQAFPVLMQLGHIKCPYTVDEVDVNVTPDKRNQTEVDVAGWTALQIKRIAEGIEGFASRDKTAPVPPEFDPDSDIPFDGPVAPGS